MGQRASTGLNTFNQFWSVFSHTAPHAEYSSQFRVYIIPLFGAYLADTRWGRFKTICISVAIALIGHVLLIVSSIPGIIDHSHASLAVFIVALIVMGLGTGGFKANISPLVAEQYKRSKLFVATRKSGERVVVDPNLTTARIYMVCHPLIPLKIASDSVSFLSISIFSSTSAPLLVKSL